MRLITNVERELARCLIICSAELSDAEKLVSPSGDSTFTVNLAFCYFLRTRVKSDFPFLNLHSLR
jgi:hypothetical protein